MWYKYFQIEWLSQFLFAVVFSLALSLGCFIFWQKGREEHFDEAELIDVVLGAFFTSLIGARLVYILINFEQFGLNLWYWLTIWSRPGFHWLGLYLGFFYSFVRSARKAKWEIYKSLDLVVIGLAFCQSFVNLSLFLAGSNIGVPTDLPLGVQFTDTFEARHPLGLYGFIFWLLAGRALWWLEGKYRRFVWYQRSKGVAKPGFVFNVYLILLGLGGLFLHSLDTTPFVLIGVDIDMLSRALVALIGMVGLFYRSGLVTSLDLPLLSGRRGKCE